MKHITVAIDGPAGSGKSTVAKAVARRLGYVLVDSGAIYRAVALLASRRGCAFDDDEVLGQIASELQIRYAFDGDINRVFVFDEDVTDLIRTAAISSAASQVAARPVVRQGLLELQRRLAGKGGAVLEGRDIGTVVCPEAEVKFFLEATEEERARRRHAELVGRGEPADLAQVLADVRDRDARDRGRQVAPLVPAVDAQVLDSTELTPEAVIEQVIQAVGDAVGRF